MDVPGGFLEVGEHPVRGIEREVREELGVRIEVEEDRSCWRRTPTGLMGSGSSPSVFGASGGRRAKPRRRRGRDTLGLGRRDRRPRFRLGTRPQIGEGRVGKRTLGGNVGAFRETPFKIWPGPWPSRSARVRSRASAPVHPGRATSCRRPRRGRPLAPAGQAVSASPDGRPRRRTPCFPHVTRWYWHGIPLLHP